MGLTQASGFSVPRLCTLLKEWAGLPSLGPRVALTSQASTLRRQGSGLLGSAASSQDVPVICQWVCCHWFFVCLLADARHSWRDLESAGNVAERTSTASGPSKQHWQKTSPFSLECSSGIELLCSSLILHPFPLRAAKCSEHQERVDKDTVSPGASTVKLDGSTVPQRPGCPRNRSRFLANERTCALTKSKTLITTCLFFSYILNSTKADPLTRYILRCLSFTFSLKYISLLWVHIHVSQTPTWDRWSNPGKDIWNGDHLGKFTRGRYGH